MASLFPLLFNNWWEDLDEPHHIGDQHFGAGLHPEHLHPSNMDVKAFVDPTTGREDVHRAALLPHGHYYRPWWNKHHKETKNGLSIVKPDKDNFQVVLDVQQFAPEDITVKVVGKYVLVEGSHDEKKDDHGWITRKFTRRYLIPEKCDLDKVESSISSDGVLTISVPRKEQLKNGEERVVSIEKTGKPALKATDKSIEDK